MKGLHGFLQWSVGAMGSSYAWCSVVGKQHRWGNCGLIFSSKYTAKHSSPDVVGVAGNPVVSSACTG